MPRARRIGVRPNPGRSVAIIGGGPAGLMAAEAASNTGVRVDVYEAMPSVGRDRSSSTQVTTLSTAARPVRKQFTEWSASS